MSSLTDKTTQIASLLVSGQGEVRRPVFLKTKLLPPRPAPELLSRPRLIERLKSNLENPVTLVTANAGTGKTTLVAEFVRSFDESCVWYQLDHTDADPLVFLGYLARGIASVVPGFGALVDAYLLESFNQLLRDPERAADVLLNDLLENVESKLFIVLDDYHHLGSNTAVHLILDRLIQYMPEQMHIVIISREQPALALARLHSQLSLAVIDREQLLFTEDETRELFKLAFGAEPDAQDLSEYRDRAGGWITALQLVRQVVRRRGSAPQAAELNGAALTEILGQSERDIFEYFAEEVFAAETSNVQKLLLNISMLERIEASTCAEVFPAADSASILPDLVRRNVFITVARDDGDEEYRLHPLFHGFLKKRARLEFGTTYVVELHRRFANYFLSIQRLEPALRHLIAAGDLNEAASLIALHGEEWFDSGALNSLENLLSQIPTESLERFPRTLAYRADLSRIKGDLDSSEADLRRAILLLKEHKDVAGEADALQSLAAIARRRGEFDTVFSLLDAANNLAGNFPRIRMKCGNTRGLSLLALGQFDAAEGQFREALQDAETLGDQRYARLIAHNLGLPAGMRGDFGEALRWFNRMLGSRTLAASMPQDATAHLNVARFQLYRGNVAECERHLDRALELCQQFNLKGLHGEIFEAYGSLNRERGDTATAEGYFDRAALAYRDLGVEISLTELDEERALLMLSVGEYNNARQIIDSLISARLGVGDALKLSTAGLTRARILLAQGDFKSAGAELGEPYQFFHENHLYYYEAQAALALAVVAYETHDDPGMIVHLRRAIDLAARFDYEHLLRREAGSLARLATNPDAVDLFPNDLRQYVNSYSQVAQVARPEPLSAKTAPFSDLSILILGPVEIVRDPRRSLAADAWTTKRARDILCFIASRPHRRASKDQIIETFWRDAEIDAVEKNFHPTISHIRKALNSNQPLKLNFILYRDGDYLLNPEIASSIDIESFDRLASAGDAARREGDRGEMVKMYEQAIELYRGEFMHGSWDDWVIEQRSFYHEEQIRMLDLLAGDALESGDWARTIIFSHRVLQDDAYREDVHCKLMKAYAAMGNRAAAKEQYERLERLLKEDLNIKPAASTTKLVTELLK